MERRPNVLLKFLIAGTALDIVLRLTFALLYGNLFPSTVSRLSQAFPASITMVMLFFPSAVAAFVAVAVTRTFKISHAFLLSLWIGFMLAAQAVVALRREFPQPLFYEVILARLINVAGTFCGGILSMMLRTPDYETGV